MRKTYRELTRKLRKSLAHHLDDWDQIDTVIKVEAMLWGFQKLPGNGNAYDAWSVIPGFDWPILPEDANLAVAFRMRILFSFFRSESVWLSHLNNYRAVEAPYRCFQVEEDGSFHRIEPRFATERMKEYEKLFDKPVPRKKNSLPLGEPGEFKYWRREGDDLKAYSGEIPQCNANDLKQLPDYVKKKNLQLPVSFDWLSLAAEMDSLEGGANDWQATARQFHLSSLNNKKILNYEGAHHVAGGLGAGKSRFMVMETFRLVKHCGAKVGLVEGSVAQVLKRVHSLKRLGIKAVPIIGNSMRQRHLENRLYAYKADQTDISSWLAGEHEVIRHLSGKCLIHALAREYEYSSFYPCANLYQGEKRVKCPLIAECGVHQDACQLVDADVWVATPASVLKTRLPASVDPYERNIFEAMYDLLDVIFIDEADEVQRVFDETFMSEYNLIGSSDHVFEQLERQVAEKTNGKYEKNAHNTIVFNFHQHLSALSSTVWKMYHRLSKCKSLRQNLRHKKVFHIYRLAYELVYNLAANAKQEKKLWLHLKQFIKEPMGGSVLAEAANSLLTTSPMEPELEVVERFITKIGGKIRNRSKSKLIYEQLEFFLYLGRIEHHMSHLLNHFNLVQAELDIQSDLSTMFTMRKDYLPFIKDGMTGMVFGYRYEVPEDAMLGRFKFFEYTGIGRLLLRDWCRVYQAADEKKGPGIVMLSGTSYAPGSHHYHLDVPIEWLIRSGRQQPEVHQEFTPVLDDTRGDYLYVSGIGDKDERGNVLYRMVNLCKPKIKRELKFWQEQHRRVLLVVNSYDDLESVARAFQEGEEWAGRFRILSRENRYDEIYYPLSRIENFYREKARVLAVPLLAVNRGYNILDEEFGALFGSAFFLIRPYPVPNNMRYMIQILHAYLPHFMQQINSESLTFKQGIRKLRRESFKRLETMIRKPEYWAILREKEREILGWFTLIPVWQMVGRLLRGNRKARVFYVDNKFNQKPENQRHIPSMLEFWAQLMQQEKESVIFQELYGPFMDSIETAAREDK